jgi:hypothetical protein
VSKDKALAKRDTRDSKVAKTKCWLEKRINELEETLAALEGEVDECHRFLQSLVTSSPGNQPFLRTSTVKHVRDLIHAFLDIDDSMGEEKFEVNVTTVRVDGYYRHYKGRVYKVLSIGQDEETGESLVVYQENQAEGKIWIRPLAHWAEWVDSVRRFTEVEGPL